MVVEDKKNLSDIAYEKIKEMILGGDIKQGQAISISSLAEQLNISRTPVTNACQKLEFEKLVTILPKQGVIVNAISIEEACGIYELRAAIESYNAKHVFDRLNKGDIAALKSSIAKQIEYVNSDDIHAFMNEDHFFHRYILTKNLNPELLSVINQLYDRAYILGMKNNLTSRLHESIEEHQRIVDALESNDRQSFADAIEENILNGFRSLTRRYLT